jgi:phage-related baseplate assembly protein
LNELFFAEANPEKILADLTAEFEKVYKNATGQSVSLRPADTVRLMLATVTFAEEHLEVLIDYCAKMNLVQYSEGKYLDALVYGVTDPRKDPVPAYTTVEFRFSTAIQSAQTIPKGTRVTAGDSVYWATAEDVTVPAKSTSVSSRCYCLIPGAEYNGYAAGTITTLVDTSNVRYFASLSNTDTSSGGADRETDDELRERIRIAPESFSTAGPELAYVYFAKQYDANISDVRVVSPTPGTVQCYVAMKDGTKPSAAYFAGLLGHLSKKNKRPLTDNVSALSPEDVTYSINASYYIDSENAAMETEIKAAVEKAAENYVVWQSSKIGRDIDPSELIRLMKNAGASRVTVSSPVFTDLKRGDYNETAQTYDAVQIARLTAKTISYGGMSDG